MLKLYTWKTPNGYKTPILLEELGLEYELIPINITKGEQKTPEFIAMNPNGKIPVLVDEDAEGGSITLFESGAILEYLAEKYKDKSVAVYPQDVHGKYLVKEWLQFQMAGVGPMLGQLGHFVRFAPEKVPYAITRYTDEAKRLLGILDKQLGEVSYLAGEYSIADIATWPWIRVMKNYDVISLSDYPNLSKWVDEIAVRPAVQKALEKVDAVCV